MKLKSLLLLFVSIVLLQPVSGQKARTPWENGKLRVTANGRYLEHANGTPFFWQGETGWLASSRLTRDNMDYYFQACSDAGYNVVQVSILHDIPFYNVYGEPALPNGFDFSKVDVPGRYGYWDHVDFMVKSAARKGIYIGLVCVWGGPVNAGHMNEKQATAYGSFLAKRYRNEPNIIWMIGGDTRGDKKTEVWQALARTIRSLDPGHLMTYHPRGRTSSVEFFHNEKWLDFNMFQSGHRRYFQTRGDGEKTIEPENNEDNWRFVEQAYAVKPAKPVLDGEPSYEDIPAGLHDADEPRWQACDARRYAWWSVMAGSFGHTYGNNSIMQMLTPGVKPSFFADKPWYEALKLPGFSQMQYLKKLMTVLPFTQGQPDQSILTGENGIRYERLIAFRGPDFALVYDYTGKPVGIDLTKISGIEKNLWWYQPSTGALRFIEKTASGVKTYTPSGEAVPGNDWVLVAIDAAKNYLKTDSSQL